MEDILVRAGAVRSFHGMSDLSPRSGIEYASGGCLKVGADKVQIDFTEGRLATKMDPTGAPRPFELRAGSSRASAPSGSS